MTKKRRAAKLVLFLFITALAPLHGQVRQTHSIVLGFLQIRDQFNLGMVFNGIQLEYRYGVLWKIYDTEMLFQPKIAVGAAFNRGITGIQIRCVPVNVTWIMPFYESAQHSLKGGFTVTGDYSFQMYPGLHNGHLFWMTEIGFSPLVYYGYQWEKSKISFNLQEFLFGFTSHTRKNDPYFYSLKIGDFFLKPYEDMRFGSLHNLHHTTTAVEFIPDVSESNSIVYEFDYFNLFYGMRFERLNHNFQWKRSL